ncbi:MAG: aldehyde dehydrogenase family protein, partial [Oscillospiraceae bacterium]
MIMGEAVANARQYFNTGVTLARDYRQEALAKLRRAIIENEADILQALNEDLGKSRFEGYMCEIGLVLDELSYAEKHLAKLMCPKKAITPLAQFAAKSFVCAEPYGVALIMSPWNYPFMLTLDPLIGAIAAGNCA